jgi:hypothetical protein
MRGFSASPQPAMRRFALLLAAVLTAAATAQTPPPPLTLEQLYRAQPYRGEAAKEARFSHSGRYLAYLWNPHGEPGSDLYVHDTRSGQTQRVTSPTALAAFDGPEELERFERKRAQREQEWRDAQAREEAQQAYLRGAAVDLGQWDRAILERVKKEAADKKARLGRREGGAAARGRDREARHGGAGSAPRRQAPAHRARRIGFIACIGCIGPERQRPPRRSQEGRLGVARRTEAVPHPQQAQARRPLPRRGAVRLGP